MRYPFLFICFTLLSASLFSQKHKIQGAYLSIGIDTLSYGQIEFNTSGERVIEIKNTGNEPLIINSCKASCGCTVPNCPTTKIAPGNLSEIKVIYDTKRIGVFNKTVTIKSNAINSIVYLKINGEVLR
tara:strand:+ start:1228 stop:1611 length:384 start_codon:yes stop_codon:yes gene_type:complete